jgi:hypothetical protein
MHGEVLTYNSGTGVLTVDINHHTGSGTYASWVVNVGGVVPAASVAWGSISGTLGSQTDLATALNAKLASADAATTYQTLSGMSSYLSKAGNLSGLADTGTARTNLGLGTMATATATDYLSKAGNLSGVASPSTARTNLGLGTIATFNDAPSDGSQYARKNGAWDVVSGGGGSAAWGGITGTLSDQTDLQAALDDKYNASNPDGFIPDSPPSSSVYYVRREGEWIACSVVTVLDVNGDPFNVLYPNP